MANIVYFLNATQTALTVTLNDVQLAGGVTAGSIPSGGVGFTPGTGSAPRTSGTPGDAEFGETTKKMEISGGGVPAQTYKDITIDTNVHPVSTTMYMYLFYSAAILLDNNGVFVWGEVKGKSAENVTLADGD